MTKNDAKIFETRNLQAIPLLECDIGDVYKVTKHIGDWYRVKTEIDGAFIIEGWIHKNFVTQSKRRNPKQTPGNDTKKDTPVDSMQTSKNNTRTHNTNDLSIENDAYDAVPIDTNSKDTIHPDDFNAHLSFIIGTQDQRYTLLSSNTQGPPTQSDLPFGLLLGLKFSYDVLTFDRHDIGFEFNYMMSLFSFNISVNNESLTNTYSARFQSAEFYSTYAYNFKIIPKNLKLKTKLGARYTRFGSTENEVDDNGVPQYYYVDYTAIGFSTTPIELSYIFPFGKSSNFGLTLGVNFFVKPNYSEETFDYDNDGTKDAITGKAPFGFTFNYIPQAELFYEWNRFYVSIAYQRYGVNVIYHETGTRLGETVENGQTEELMTAYYATLGLLF